MKWIETPFKPIDFKVFIVVERKYVSDEREQSNLKAWRYWLAKYKGLL